MVYFDNELGGMVLNPSGTKVAYIAEAKKPKNSPFFPTKNNKANGGKDEPQDFGKEFSYTEEWGEQLVGKSQSVIAIFDLETSTVDVLQDLVPEDLCPGKVIIHKLRREVSLVEQDNWKGFLANLKFIIKSLRNLKKKSASFYATF